MLVAISPTDGAPLHLDDPESGVPARRSLGERFRAARPREARDRTAERGRGSHGGDDTGRHYDYL